MEEIRTIEFTRRLQGKAIHNTTEKPARPAQKPWLEANSRRRYSLNEMVEIIPSLRMLCEVECNERKSSSQAHFQIGSSAREENDGNDVRRKKHAQIQERWGIVFQPFAQH